jgi:hypothetical protein
MKLIVQRAELEYLAKFTGKTVEQTVEALGAVEYEVLIREHANKAITDRINLRLQGVYVAPAWVEALRRK